MPMNLLTINQFFDEKLNPSTVEDFLKTNDGGQPPVIHVDSTAPLYSDKNKK